MRFGRIATYRRYCNAQNHHHNYRWSAVLLYVEPGHRANVAIEGSGSGALGWNETPFNADAGPLENAELVGAGIDCGQVSVNAAYIGPSLLTGDRFVDVTCTDHDIGLYSASRVYLTPAGPVI